MSNIKKIIGILLALVMALSMAAIAFAAPVANPEYSVKVTADETELEPGQSANVTVTVTSNFNVSAVSIPVYFDKTKVTVSEAKSDLANAKIARETSVGAEKYFEGLEDLTTENCGLVAVVYVAAQGTEISSYNNKTVMTFKVTANENATGSVDLECFASTVKKSDHPSGTLYVAMNGTNNNEKVDALGVVVDNANVEGAKATIKIAGEEIANTLAIKEDAIVTPYIDTVNSEGTDYTAFIYGIDTLGSVSDDGSLADNLTTALGDEYLEIEEADGGETTGTIIKVLNKDGTVAETYVFIYFGDIDMDGMITSTDGFATEYYEGTGEGIDELYQLIAGDVDGDGMITSTDGFSMEYFEGTGEGILEQQEIAEMVLANVYEM